MTKLLFLVIIQFFLLLVEADAYDDGLPFEINFTDVNPDLESPSALAFDSFNRPYMFNSESPKSFGYILTIRNKEWVRLNYINALKNYYPDMMAPNKKFKHALGSIYVDGDDNIYAVVRLNKSNTVAGYALLFSNDAGKSFKVYDLPGIAFLEIWTGNGSLESPPAIGNLQKLRHHPARWTSYHRFEVYLPSLDGAGNLILGEPLVITSDSFGIANHSGGYSFAVTQNKKTHMVYVEIPPNGVSNPTYVATVDRMTRKVTKKHFLINAPPKKPNVHSTPVIAAGINNDIHVLTGAHSQSFEYFQYPDPAQDDLRWSDAIPQGNNQTYATLISDQAGGLHTVYRDRLKLLYLFKNANDKHWSKPKVIAHAPKGYNGYAVFYHRLFIDRRGGIYLSYTFYGDDTDNKLSYPRALLMSSDTGESWRLVTTREMINRFTGVLVERY